MDAAYVDKLDGKIPVDFWERKMSEWRMEEQQVKMALANKAYSLYVSQNPVEKAKLLKMLFSNCSIDAVSVTPTYRKPFDMIFKRAHLEEWSGRLDSN
jgi:site-specific DNA recombinase